MTPDVRYPREYRMTRGWRIFCVLFGFPLFVLGAAGLVGAALLDEGLAVAVLAGLGALFIAALGAYTLAYGLSRQPLLVLREDAFEIPGIGFFRSTIVRRRDIAGVRRFTHNGVTTLIVTERKPAGGTRHRNIGQLFAIDDELAAWFGPGLDQDARDLAASTQEIEADSRLGDSVAERRESIAQAAKTTKFLRFGTLALMAWAFLYPRPYVPLMLGLAAVPWLVMAICLRWPARFTLRDDAKKTLRSQLVVDLMMPGFVLGLRAIRDVAVIDAWELLAPSAGVLAVVMLALLLVEPSYRRAGKIALMAALMAAYAGAVVALGNAVFDRSTPTWHAVDVVEKHLTSGKHTRRVLTIGGWPGADVHELDVPRALYDATAVGDVVCVAVMDGALGIAWYEVDAADRCLGDRAGTEDSDGD